MIDFSKVTLQGDGVHTRNKRVKREVVIKPGMKPGMQLKFVGEGNC